MMHEELKAAGSSGYLAALVGGSVGKALRLLAEKAEYMAAAGPELRQVCAWTRVWRGAVFRPATLNPGLCGWDRQPGTGGVAWLAGVPVVSGESVG